MKNTHGANTRGVAIGAATNGWKGSRYDNQRHAAIFPHIDICPAGDCQPGFLPDSTRTPVPAFGCARRRCPVQLVRRKLRRDPQSPPQRIDIHVGGAGSLIRIKRRLNGQHLCASRVPIAHRECLSAIRVPGAASQARGQPGWRGETPWDRARFSCC